MSDFLDFDINELPDLEEFKPLLNGVYDVEGISMEHKIIETKKGDLDGIEVKVKLLNIREVKPASTPDEDLPLIGTEVNYFLPYKSLSDDADKAKRGTVNCLGRIKKLMSPFAIAFGTANSNEIKDKFVGAKFILVNKLRKVKGNEAEGTEDKFYSSIDNVIFE